MRGMRSADAGCLAINYQSLQDLWGEHSVASDQLEVVGFRSVFPQSQEQFLERVALSVGGHLPSSQFKNNYLAELCSGSEAGSYLRLIDGCITQL